MRHSVHCQRIIICFVLLVGAAFAAEPRQHFIETREIQVQEILGGPSAPGSAETLREVEMVLAKQAARTPVDEARIKREGKWSPFLFDDVLGSWYTEQNLPRTAAFLDTVGRDTMDICEMAKRLWPRPRPPLQDPRIHPAVGLPTTSSYPSGHGAYGVVLGTILADLAPELKEQLIKRGEEIGADRVLGGFHFPSDIEAGRALARVILERFRANPEFRVNLEKAKKEFRAVRSHHTAPAHEVVGEGR